MKKIATTVFIAALMLAACTPKAKPTAGVPENVPLVGTEWKLVELFGKPVEDADIKSAGFVMLQKEGKFSASAGCNTILGGYDLKEPFAISFKSNMASTMMACPKLEKEDNFKKVLSETNAYQLSGNKLSFSKNKMAPFARFEAVPKSR